MRFKFIKGAWSYVIKGRLLDAIELVNLVRSIADGLLLVGN